MTSEKKPKTHIFTLPTKEGVIGLDLTNYEERMRDLEKKDHGDEADRPGGERWTARQKIAKLIKKKKGR